MPEPPQQPKACPFCGASSWDLVEGAWKSRRLAIWRLLHHRECFLPCTTFGIGSYREPHWNRRATCSSSPSSNGEE